MVHSARRFPVISVFWQNAKTACNQKNVRAITRTFFSFVQLTGIPSGACSLLYTWVYSNVWLSQFPSDHVHRTAVSQRHKEFDQENSRQDIRQHRDFPGLSVAALNDSIGDQGKTDAMADGTGDRHSQQHDGNRCHL